MKDYIKEGIDLFMQEYNCAQAVFGALSKKIGFPLEDALRIAAPFGGGIARSRNTCGALAGALMAIGYTHPQASKADIYEISRKYMEEFDKALGSTECRELLGFIEDDSITPSPRTKEYYESRPCVHIVSVAVEVALRYID